MNTILLIIALQIAVTLLSGCSTMQNKIDEMHRLNCEVPPVHSICEPNESLLICDSADKKDCHGWLIE
jgi:hypothetical protein